MKNIIKEIILIITGTFIMTIGINLFLLSNELTTGGATGIATITYYLFNMPVGLMVLMINIPLFIIAIFKLGIRFCIRSIFATGMFTVFLDIIQFESWLNLTSTDLIISSIFGGIFVGLGISLVFKAGASTGGSDLVAQILSNRKGVKLNISSIMLIIDSIILLMLLIAFKNLNNVLYSIIAIYIQNKIIDLVFDGINFSRIANIITDGNNNIIKDINEKLQRGVTVYEATGGYTGDKKINVTCVINLYEMGKLKSIITDNDKEAFTYITSANEVYGNGFKKYKGEK